MMSTDRFYLDSEGENMVVKDRQNDLIVIRTMSDAAYMMNKLEQELDELKHYILYNNTKKDDDGGFHVWEVPPVKHGCRITTRTYGSEPK